MRGFSGDDDVTKSDMLIYSNYLTDIMELIVVFCFIHSYE